ncbi:MAG: hypothetical protein K0S41_465 [Anaerocolumna sp.]|nr:hypothetical protein [Anaerocolumna sp.]
MLGGDSLHIKELLLSNFGKFHNKSMILKNGINVIYGDNEAGKSTIHSFIKGMLFGIDKTRGRASKDDVYLKYQPWDTPGSYNGSMDIEVDDTIYRISRNFDKNNKECNVIDLNTGREVKIHSDGLSELFYGLTEAGYRNTISIEQLKSKTDQELVNEVRNYITNLSLSKSNEVDVSNALSFLQTRKKQLEAEQINEKLTLLEDEITGELEIESKIDKLTNKLKGLEIYNNQLKEKNDNFSKDIKDNKVLTGFTSKGEIQSYLDSFTAMKEKYGFYQESIVQKEAYTDKLTEITKQLQVIEIKPGEQNLEKQIDISLNYQADLNNSFINMKQEIEKETYLKGIRQRIRLFLLIPVILGMLGFIFFVGKNTLMTSISGVFIVLDLLASFIILNHYKSKQKLIQNEILKWDKKRQQLQLQINTILKDNHASDIQDLRKKQEEIIKNEVVVEQLKVKIKEYNSQINVLDEKISTMKRDMNSVLTRFNYAYEKLEIANQSLLDETIMNQMEEYTNVLKHEIQFRDELQQREQEELRLQIEKLRWEITTYEGNEEKLLRNQELHKELLQKKAENDQELTAIKLAIDTIYNLSVDIHDSFGQKLNNYVSDLSKDFTNNKYESIKVDEKLTVKVGSENRFVTLDKLSAGTIEQLYFSIRMAISDLIYGEGNLPILLDDCFVLYDDKRTKATLKALLEKRSGQVIIFTCHNREKALLDELGAEYHYIELT